MAQRVSVNFPALHSRSCTALSQSRCTKEAVRESLWAVLLQLWSVAAFSTRAWPGVLQSLREVTLSSPLTQVFTRLCVSVPQVLAGAGESLLALLLCPCFYRSTQRRPADFLCGWDSSELLLQSSFGLYKSVKNSVSSPYSSMTTVFSQCSVEDEKHHGSLFCQERIIIFQILFHLGFFTLSALWLNFKTHGFIDNLACSHLLGLERLHHKWKSVSLFLLSFKKI